MTNKINYKNNYVEAAVCPGHLIFGKIQSKPSIANPKQGPTEAEQQMPKDATPAKMDIFQLVFFPKQIGPLAFEGLNVKRQVVSKAFTLLCFRFFCAPCVFHLLLVSRPTHNALLHLALEHPLVAREQAHTQYSAALGT